MPIKWTAPEILLGNVAELSTQSDVYVQYRFFLLPQLRLCYTRPYGFFLATCFAILLRRCETTEVLRDIAPCSISQSEQLSETRT